MRLKEALIRLLIFFSILGWTCVVCAQGNAEAKAVKDWKRYHLGDGLYSILLPGEPDEKIDEQTPVSGFSYKSYIYTVTVEKELFAVSHSLLPDAADKWSEGAVESFYNGIWEGIAGGFDTVFEKNGISWKTNLLEKRKLKVGGYDGREMSFSLGNLRGRVMMTLVGHRAFTAMTVGTEQKPEDQEKFFGSLTINAPSVKQ